MSSNLVFRSLVNNFLFYYYDNQSKGYQSKMRLLQNKFRTFCNQKLEIDKKSFELLLNFYFCMVILHKLLILLYKPIHDYLSLAIEVKNQFNKRFLLK